MKEELKNKLTDMQYHVTQENGTEPPFRNEFDSHYEEGIYVDIVSGKPLSAQKINMMRDVDGQALRNQLKHGSN